MRSVNLDVADWRNVPTDPEIADHVASMLESDDRPKFVLFLTDDGWAVDCTIRTAGAFSSVAQTFMLPESASKVLDEIYDDAIEVIVFGEELS